MAGRIRLDEVSYPAEDMTPNQIPRVMAHVDEVGVQTYGVVDDGELFIEP